MSTETENAGWTEFIAMRPVLVGTDILEGVFVELRPQKGHVVVGTFSPYWASQSCSKDVVFTSFVVKAWGPVKRDLTHGKNASFESREGRSIVSFGLFFSPLAR